MSGRLAWLIVGGGIHGTHLALRLLAAGVDRSALRILDPVVGVDRVEHRHERIEVLGQPRLLLRHRPGVVDHEEHVDVAVRHHRDRHRRLDAPLRLHRLHRVLEAPWGQGQGGDEGERVQLQWQVIADHGGYSLGPRGPALVQCNRSVSPSI